MSGPAVHYLVGKDIRNYLDGNSSQEIDEVIKGMIDHPTYLNAGTLGPDFLFFNTKDMPGPVGKLFDLYRDVAKFVNGFKESISVILKFIEDAKEKAEDAMSNSVVLSQVQGLVGDANTAISGISATIEEKVKYHITKAVDVFSLLKNPIQVGDPLNKWWWFDTLHYRRTGSFAQALFENSIPSSKYHAYAMGYLSHIGSDVVGHPFINMLTGGPYRHHPQRHKVIETYQDVHAFEKYKNKEFVRSGLHNEFSFNPGSYDAGNMPRGLCSLIQKSMTAVYGNEFNDLMSSHDINDAYWLWYEWFRNTTETGTLPVPETYSLTGELQDAWETFVNNVDGVGDLIQDASNAGGGGFLGFLAALAAAILAPFLLAAALIDYLAGTLLTIGVAPFRFLLTIAYEGLYNSYMRYREGVALIGVGYPLTQHLQNPWINHMLHPRFADPLGSMRQQNEDYPLMAMQAPAPGFQGATHLIYPYNASVELALRIPCSSHYYRNQYDWYFKGSVPFDLDIYKQIIDLDESNINDLQGMISKYPLGNAPRFTAELFLQYRKTGNIPDFNLDGDRGMGYKAWRVVPTQQDPEPAVASPVKEDII